MSLSSSISRLAAVAVLIFSLAGLTLADTVRLKDGSIIKGKIVSFDNGKFVIVMGEGARRKELTFTAAEIESITFDTPASSPAVKPTNTATYQQPVSNDPVPVKVVSQKLPDPAPARSTSNGGSIKPITWDVKVLADNTANGWTNTGWVVKKGQRIRITGEGTVSLGKGKTSSPAGVPELNDDMKLLKNVATGALLAVIGDDNNDFIYVGASREFTATRDGALFLGLNEGNLDDNSGSYSVKIEILPDDGSGN
ncbi:MAG: hypothetical protein JO053_01250 [Acidobacteria bacterium]|nr:hypothetical protein [Acidobacteriota bacterium]